MIHPMNKDLVWLSLALRDTHPFNVAFTDNTGLIAATDNHRVHIVEHDGRFEPWSIYSMRCIAGNVVDVEFIDSHEFTHMWAAIHTHMNTRGLIPIPVKPADPWYLKLILNAGVSSYNIEYVKEAMIDGYAYPSGHENATLVIKGGIRTALVLPTTPIKEEKNV